MRNILILGSLLFSLPLVSWSSEEATVPTVPRLELNAYLGKWYELVRMPNDFQDEIDRDGSGFSNCKFTTATYGRLSDGKISVTNRCLRVNKSGQKKLEVARARASVVEGSHGSKLKVNFTGIPLLEWLGIGDGDYWVMALGPKNEAGQYSYSLVVSPSRDYAWILSRTETLPDSTIKELVEKLKREGFDTRGLVYQ